MSHVHVLQKLKDYQNSVDVQILEERNINIRLIEHDMCEISDIMNDLSRLVSEQGKKVDLATENVETSEIHVREAVVLLEEGEEVVSKIRGVILDSITIVSLTGLGALGFIGGPIVGVPTTFSGLMSGIAVITLRRNVTGKK